MAGPNILSRTPWLDNPLPPQEAKPPQPSLLSQLGNTWPAQAAKSAWSGVTAPGDAWAGKIAPEDMNQRAWDMAGLVTGGSAFAPAEEGSILRMGAKPFNPMDIAVPQAETASAGPTREALARIKAYHGSPYDFTQFSSNSIGSGEGAQAYGHGLYFADNEAVAQGYRDKLSSQVTYKGQPLGTHPMDSDVETAKHSIASAVARGENPRGAILNQANEWRSSANSYAKYVNDMSFPEEARQGAARQAANFHKIADEIEKFDPTHFVKNPGHMYEVNINADPAHFLDWDKPLAEQPQAVRDAMDTKMNILKQRGDILMPSYVEQYEKGTLSGPQVYSGIGGQAAQSTEALKQAGVPGIKYLDAGSRGAGEGSRNYVVFDDKLVSIVKKYGITGAVAMGAMTAEQAKQFQTQQAGNQDWVDKGGT